MTKPIIIAGGGIGGLALASLLQRRGLPCVVLERRSGLAEGGSGLALWPNATSVLGRLDMLDPLSAQGSILARSRLCHWRGRTLKEVPVSRLQTHFGAPTITISRADLQALLLDSLLDREAFRSERQCTSFQAHEDGVEVALADGSSLQGRCLIGADGQRSAIRSQLFPETALRYSGRTSWRGLVTLSQDEGWLAPGDMHEILGPGQRMGALPAGPLRYYWYIQRNAPQDALPDAFKSALLEFTEGWTTPVQPMIEATPETEIIRTDLYHLPPLKRWWQGRVALLGDAAHAMTPDLGQGACQAILDAASLADALAEHSDIAAAFAQYEARRRSGASQVQRASRMGGWVRQWRWAPLRWCRDLGILCMPKAFLLQGLKRLIAL